MRHAAPQDVERLDQGHAGFEQRGQFLVEHQELAGGNAAADAASGNASDPMPRRGRSDEDADPLLLEFVAQVRFAVGDMELLDDLTVRRPEPAAIFHRNSRLNGK